MESIDELQDELTLQQVMLSSLEGSGMDDEAREQEQTERRIEIANLKKKLEIARRKGVSTARSNEAPRTSSFEQAGSEPPAIRQERRVPAAGRSPAQDHRNSTSAGPSNTGSGSFSQANEGFPEHHSQSRKRDFASTTLGASHPANKSRRTTPVHFDDDLNNHSPWSNSGASSASVDFIDLTGDDSFDADFVAAQSRAERQHEQQHEQEMADRQLALRLSQSQTSPSPAPGPVPSQNNALNRIMATQRLNSLSNVEDRIQYENFDPEEARLLQIPGAYNTTWDESSTASSTGNMMNQYVPRDSHNPVSSSYRARFGHGVIPNGGVEVGEIDSVFGMGPASRSSQPRAPVLPSQRGQMSLPGNGGPNAARSNGPYTHGRNGLNTFGGHGFDPLSEVINRTSGYDFVNRVDRFGDPLPQEVTDYVNHLFHDPSLEKKEIEDLLANIRPDMAIPEHARGGTPEGLKGTLYPHQEVALAWLKKMEEGTNKGGILADDMGLGKTISMLSLILSRPATSRPKTNLVVGPLSLLKQWEEEIRSKVKSENRLSVFVCHGTKKKTPEELLMYDVVLTTYGTLASQHKRLEALHEEQKRTGRQIDFRDKATAVKIALMHPNAKFYRVILDEAQCIKNRNTQSAKAATALKATHRWCLSGTPMMNSVEELFSLIQFLRIKPYCQWDSFRRTFGRLFGKSGDNSQTQAMNRLRTVLKAIMLRRKKDSLLDGKPIVRLPPKTESVVQVELSTDERDFYNQLEKKSQVIFNKYLREGSVGKNYSNILVLLLRLRQACCHPHLNLDVEDAVTRSDEDMEALVKQLDPSSVARIKALDTFECPICYDAVPSPCFFVPCGHDSCSQCLAHLADSSDATNIQAGIDTTGGPKARCPVCRELFDPTKCFTLEAFQKVHQPEKIKKEEAVEESDPEDLTDSSDTDDDDDNDDDVDHKGNLRGFIVEDDFESDTEDADDETKDVKPEMKSDVKLDMKHVPEMAEDKKPKKKTKRRNKGKGKAKDTASDVKPSMLKALRKEASKNRAAYKKYMAYLRKTWLPSVKSTECINLLKTIQETGEKTIVFSQWTLLLDLIEVGMKHEGFEHPPVRYDGGMSATDRNDSATKFRNSKTANVILVSLKAGNAGLNLAAASRVIILDPFWNPYIEMQAIDRAYRIGQQREVQVHRILTEATVEDRIIALQEKKKNMIESAMDEAEGRKISRLSINELKYLFNGS